MKVSELIRQLQKLDGERLVVCAADPEGNSFSALHQVDEDDGFCYGDIRGVPPGMNVDVKTQVVILWPS